MSEYKNGFTASLGGKTLTGLVYPIAKSFFEAKGIENYYYSDKSFSDVEYEDKQLKFLPGFYSAIKNNITKINGKVEINIGYCITHDKLACKTQCSKTGIFYDCFFIKDKPVIFLIYIGIDDIFSFNRGNYLPREITNKVETIDDEEYELNSLASNGLNYKQISNICKHNEQAVLDFFGGFTIDFDLAKKDGLTWMRRSLKTNEDVRAFVKIDVAAKMIIDFNKTKYKGFDDWRLPTYEELKSLHVKKNNGYFINQHVFDVYRNPGEEGEKERSSYFTSTQKSVRNGVVTMNTVDFKFSLPESDERVSFIRLVR